MWLRGVKYILWNKDFSPLCGVLESWDKNDCAVCVMFQIVGTRVIVWSVC